MSEFNIEGRVFKRGQSLSKVEVDMIEQLKNENVDMSDKEMVNLVVRKLRISRNTAKKYLEDDEKPKRGRPKFSGKILSIPVIEYIIFLTITLPFLILKDIKKRIFEKFGFAPVISEIKRVRDEMDYTRKKMEMINYHRKLPYVQKLRKIWREKARFFDPDSIICIDEMSFHFSDMESKYGYSKKGVKCECFQNRLSRQGFSLICAMTSKKIVHFAIYKTTGFGVTHNEFFHFLCGLFPKVNLSKWKLVMDNAANHKHSLCKMLYSNLEADINWLPPYSPEYNPIENLFC